MQDRYDRFMPAGSFRPSRQRRPILDDVTRRPEDAPLIELAVDLIVGTQDVKIAGGQPLEHEIDGLCGRSGTRRRIEDCLGIGEPTRAEICDANLEAHLAEAISRGQSGA
jgi:hypothetical protein